jgi:hypothetical protein
MHNAASSAVAQAVHDSLIYLYPRQTEAIGGLLDAFFKTLEPNAEGRAWGAKVAGLVIADRENDGYDAEPPLTPDSMTAPVFQHHGDATVLPLQPLYAKHFGKVRSWAVSNTTPLPDPLTLNYVSSYNQVKEQGAKNSTLRSSRATEIGIFWAYDGASKIGTPIRLYNQVMDAAIVSVGKHESMKGAAATVATGYGLARLYAMVNVAMADAAIVAWKEKYEKNFWRPITGIRAGSSDGFAETVGDATWTPLGAPVTNTALTPRTPAFPAYPSGHATMGTAGMIVVRNYLGLSDDVKMDMISDEYNGKSTNSDGSVRPLIPGHFSMSHAIRENLHSRVYLGVHWLIDCDEGEKLGTEIAEKVKFFPKRT